jgi:hypothetical protein
VWDLMKTAGKKERRKRRKSKERDEGKKASPP